MPRKPNKVEVQKFSDYVREFLEAKGAVLKRSHTFTGERIPRVSYTWTVDTVGGPADISIFGSGFELFVCFRNLLRAQDCHRFNLSRSFTGKWNHSFTARSLREVQPELYEVFNLLFAPSKGSHEPASTHTKLGNPDAVGLSSVRKAGG
jgi:hypothetical protein